LLDTELRIISICDVRTDAAIIAAIRLHRPDLVAIDAPLSRPRNPRKGRHCERLLNKRKIHVFPTTNKSFIKRLRSRGIRLKKEIEKLRVKVIEVYPYASAAVLWSRGKPVPKKTKPEGIAWFRQQLRREIPYTKPYDKLNHDECDAIIAAYTAYLKHQRKAERIGYIDEGLIYIPRRPLSFSFDKK
jgi:predicted nuclease with RNAse H fold